MKIFLFLAYAGILDSQIKYAVWFNFFSLSSLKIMENISLNSAVLMAITVLVEAREGCDQESECVTRGEGCVSV
jgi:hypothetical protein